MDQTLGFLYQNMLNSNSSNRKLEVKTSGIRVKIDNVKELIGNDTANPNTQ